MQWCKELGHVIGLLSSNSLTSLYIRHSIINSFITFGGKAMPRGKEFSQLPKSNIASSVVENPMSANHEDTTGNVGAASPPFPSNIKMGKNNK